MTDDTNDLPDADVAAPSAAPSPERPLEEYLREAIDAAGAERDDNDIVVDQLIESLDRQARDRLLRQALLSSILGVRASMAELELNEPQPATPKRRRGFTPPPGYTVVVGQSTKKLSPDEAKDFGEQLARRLPDPKK